MFQPASASASFPQQEEEILRFWKERGIYEKSLARRAGDDERHLLMIEDPHAFGIERVRTHAIVAGQQRQIPETYAERKPVGGDTARRSAINFVRRPVDRRAIRSHHSDRHDGRPSIRRSNLDCEIEPERCIHFGSFPDGRQLEGCDEVLAGDDLRVRRVLRHLRLVKRQILPRNRGRIVVEARSAMVEPKRFRA